MSTQIDDPAELGPMFTGIQSQIAEMSYEPILRETLQEIAEYEAGMFAGEFGSNLSAWAPLAESTIRRKGHDRILFETGALRESLVNVGGEGNIADANERGLVFGTEVPYAGFLQEGTRRMPARPPVGMSEETLNRLCDRIAEETIRQLSANEGR